MARERYIEKRFTASSRALIGVMDDIISDYQSQGYVLTVRQLYYQLVAKAIIPNTEKSYKNITGLVNDARLAGLLDWSGIEDRTRAFIRKSRWQSGSQIIDACVSSYHQDLWANQFARVFVIVEKEALAGVLEGVCDQYDVPLLAARGYPSGTVLRDFVRRDVLTKANEGQDIHLLHLGDHDPSGIDMSRDLQDRLDLFSYGPRIQLHRIALNMAQIEEVNPPENPAKTTDARFADYARKYGDSSWELDALTPTYLTELLSGKIEEFIDGARWAEANEVIEGVKARLSKVAEEFDA